MPIRRPTRDWLRDAMSRLISSYESAGQYDGALDIARKFIAKYPDDQSIMDMKIKVGILYEELRYFDQSLACIPESCERSQS